MIKLDLRLTPKRQTRFVRQDEVSECGLACMVMVASHFGLNIDLTSLRRRIYISTRGVSLRSLITIADSLQLTARPISVDLEHLKAISLPAILHWDLNHYVVLEKLKQNKAFILDPARGALWMDMGRVSKHFTGVALEVNPAVNFEPADIARPLRITEFWTKIRGIRRAAAQTIVLSLILYLFALLTPYYLQIAVDHALPDTNLTLLTVAALAFGGFAIINGTVNLLRASVLLAAGASLSFGLSSNIVRKLFRLPIDWFARRQVGDILSRFQSVHPIRKLLAEDGPAALVDGVLLALTAGIMLIYSPLLSVIPLLALVLYIFVRVLLFSRQRDAQEDMIVGAGKEQSVLIESLQGIRALRLARREVFRHALWQARMTDAVNGTIRHQRLTNWENSFQITIFAIENILSIWLAIYTIALGKFTLGMAFAFFAYKTQFLTTGTALVKKASDFGMLRMHLERLSDIAFADEDVGFQKDMQSTRVLRGKIELRNIRFKFGDDDPYILNDVNAVIEEGEFVAITGPSGGGKSTLLQIVVGLIQPDSGEVLIDDQPLRTFGYKNYQTQIAAVLQDDVLFRGSLVDNISLFDESPDLEFVFACARMAAIHDDIDAMPMGYSTIVGELGSSLSGGQRQRLLIARALYRRPKVLVMDESTSHLDAVREREVNRAISQLGITRVVVAHRRETISAAGRVLKLEEGKICSEDYAKGI